MHAMTSNSINYLYGAHAQIKLSCKFTGSYRLLCIFFHIAKETLNIYIFAYIMHIIFVYAAVVICLMSFSHYACPCKQVGMFACHIEKGLCLYSNIDCSTEMSIQKMCVCFENC